MVTSHRRALNICRRSACSGSLPAVSRPYYWSDQDFGRLRIICRRRGRSADLRASRPAAWDSSLSANASKVLSTRVLLPIAPRRHSAASNSQQFWRVHSIHLAIATPRLETEASADFIDVASLAAVSAVVKSSLSATHFLESIPGAAFGAPLGLLGCVCLERGVTNTRGGHVHVGIMRSRYEGSFSSASSRRFVGLTFTNRWLIFVKH